MRGRRRDTATATTVGSASTITLTGFPASTDETVVVYTRLYPRAGLPMNTRRLRVWKKAVTRTLDWVDPDTQ